MKIFGKTLTGIVVIIDIIIGLFLLGGWWYGVVYNFVNNGVLSGILAIVVGFILFDIACFIIAALTYGIVVRQIRGET